MKTTRQRLGKFYENEAKHYLLDKGLILLASNYTIFQEGKKSGEFDLIFRHPDQNVLYFIEVKFKNISTQGLNQNLYDFITDKQQNKLLELVDYFLETNGYTDYQYQFFVYAKTPKLGGLLRLA
jgi:Holliday junction resolvase-like predicted endonuclease